jgi:putative ABC transport system permease protein
MSGRVPPLLERLLRWLGPDESFGDNVVGDLVEESHARRPGARERRLWYWLHALPIAFRLAAFRVRGGGPPVGGRAKAGRSGSRAAVSAWRVMRRSPGYVLLVVTILTLALAANAVMFSVMQGTLLRPLPWSAEDRLVRLATVRDGQPYFSGTFAYPDVEDLQRSNETFDGIVAYLAGEVTLLGGTVPERIVTGRVSGNFFDVLVVAPAVGRFFSAEENELGHAPVVVLSHALWRSRYGGDPGVVGRILELDGDPFEIVGVAPADFEDPLGDPGLWIARPPLMDATQQSRYGYFISAFGRLAAGVPIDRAATDVERVVSGIREAYPGKTGMSVEVAPLREHIVGPSRAPLLLLTGVVGLLFLIGCANIANLQMSRAIGRRREWSIRAALGAGRPRLFGQALLENVFPCLFSVVAALILAAAVLPVVVTVAEPGLPRPLSSSLSLAAIGLTAAGGLVALLVCGAGPAWFAARSGIAVGLRESGRHSGSRRMVRLRGAFVVSQIALSTILLVGALLLVRSFQSLSAVDPGVDTAGILTFEVTPIDTRYPESSQITDLWQTIEARLRALPGVTVAGGATQIPMGSGMTSQFSYRRDDRPPPEPGEFTVAQARTATPGFFEAIGLRLLRGRFPGASDGPGRQNVLVVSEALVREAFAGDDPIGRRLIIQETPQEIVGIVADVRTAGPWSEPAPMVWTNQAQEPADWMRESMIFALRVDGDPLALVNAVRDAIASVDRTIAITNVRTMDRVLASNVAAPRFRALLTAGFGLIALGLAGLGVGGVIGYGVARRRTEIGIRTALGADRRRIVARILSGGVALAGAGAVLGLAAAAALAGLIRGLLFGVEPLDPVTFLAVPAALIAIGGLASSLPALHASRIDPCAALRSD